MSNFKIKIDTKKLEKELNKQIDKMIKSTEKEMRIKRKKEKNERKKTIKKHNIYSPIPNNSNSIRLYNTKSHN